MQKGIISAICAYTIWGFIAVLFKLLNNVGSTQILAHRIVWSFVILAIVIIILKQQRALIEKITRRVIIIYLLAAILIAINWFTYVWGVNNNFVIETSLGYFINPLVSVFLGMLFLREKLRLLQWLPLGIAAAGIIFLTISYGSLPWLSLILAFSFGSYGLVKKIAPLNSLQGLTIETGLMFLPALVYLVIAQFQGAPGLIYNNLGTQMLLLLSGVFTAIPLLLFAAAAQRIPLSTIGILQYIAPTIQFLIGVFIYNEAFTTSKLIGFSIIWFALVLFTLEGLNNRRRSFSQPPPILNSAIE